MAGTRTPISQLAFPASDDPLILPDEPFGGDTGCRRTEAKDTACDARDAALDQIAENTGPVWAAYAREWLLDYLRTHPTMFTDDLWDAGLVEPREMRALGPIVLALARQGHIVKTGTYRPRTKGHLAEGPVWRSTMYVAPDPDLPIGWSWIDAPPGYALTVGSTGRWAIGTAGAAACLFGGRWYSIREALDRDWITPTEGADL